MEIRGILDEDLIKQQLRQGIFAWDSVGLLIGSVVSVIERLQAAGRVEETRTKYREIQELFSTMDETPTARPRAMVRALEFLNDRINVMRIDSANAR